MNNEIYNRLLEYIKLEKEAVDTLIRADNVLGLNVFSEDIINFLEFSSVEKFSGIIVGNILITEGDIISVLCIINLIANYNNEFILYINGDNEGINTYLVNRANMIYKELGLNVQLKIDYSENYNRYINELVNIIGSREFILECTNDFPNSNKIVM